MAARPAVPDLWRRVRLLRIRPQGYRHAAAFDEVVEGFAAAFQALGSEVDVTWNEPLDDRGVNLVFGAHLLTGLPARRRVLPRNAVVFNLEQFSDVAGDTDYAGLFRRHPVWDYSPRNVALGRALAGHPHVHLVPIGYMPHLARIPRAERQDVDVLFYGSLNARRAWIIGGLQAAGLEVKVLFGMYGPARDAWIARAKVVLCVHARKDMIHEVVRSSYLLANRKAVVCELDPDTEIDPGLARAVVGVPYDLLVETCRALVADGARRRAIEDNGFAIFSAMDQAATVGAAINATSLTAPRRINLGSGKAWAAGSLNIDIAAQWSPDLLADLSEPGWIGRVVFSSRFGLIRLEPDAFDEIVATDVLEHVPNLAGLMTSCLALLKPGGMMTIAVPYDLSYGAWQDPTHVRAFNERSWLYFTDWHWYLGWLDARFDLVSLAFVLNARGKALRKQGVPMGEIALQPRAVDALRAVLRKRVLTPEERAQALAYQAAPRAGEPPS